MWRSLSGPCVCDRHGADDRERNPALASYASRGSDRRERKTYSGVDWQSDYRGVSCPPSQNFRKTSS